MDFKLRDFIPYYPERDDPQLQSKLYAKTEFTRLTAEEQKVVKADGKYDFLAHQRNISRFLSGYTPYDGLLVYHMMGTGKTNCIIACIEQIRNERPPKFVGALLLFRNEAQIEKFFTTDLPAVIDASEIVKKRSNLRKEWYECHTVGTFLSKFEKADNQEFASRYDDHMIFVDEVHNIRNDKLGVSTYQLLNRFLKSVRNSKIVLLTGTPMVDSDTEIYDIINLLIQPGRDETQIIETGDEDSLVREIQGRVSYVNSVHNPRVKMQFMENERVNSAGIESFLQKVFYIPLSEKQIVYIQALQSDDAMDEGGSDSEMEEDEYGAQFAHRTNGDHPLGDQTTGTELRPHNIRKQIQVNLSLLPGEEPRRVLRNSEKEALVGAFITAITAVNEGVRLEYLREYSPKYAACIEIIKANQSKKHFAFIWDIQGVGLNFFKALLKVFNINCISITGADSASDIIKSIKMFNTSSSVSVLLGSQVLAEGYSLLNVEFVHILTPHWNYTRIDQTIARAIRFSSHDELLNRYPGRDVRVQVYLYCMYSPQRNTYVIDQKMYQTSQSKDKKIKRMEHLLKMSGFDCRLNKLRNTLPASMDGTRQCDYEACDYPCMSDLDPSGNYNYGVDSTTDSVYFSEGKIDSIKDWIVEQLQRNVMIHIEEIMEFVTNDYTSVLHLSAIDKLLSEYDNIQLLNDVLYLTREENSNDSFLKIFQVSTQLDRYDDCRVSVNHELLHQALENNIPSLLDTLSVEYSELLFESTILLYRKLNQSLEQSKHEMLHTFFQRKKITEDAQQITSFIDPKQTRVFDKSERVWFSTEEIEEDDFPPGMKGLIDHEGNFKLITSQPTTGGSSDKRKKSRGLLCTSMETRRQRPERIKELKEMVADNQIDGSTEEGALLIHEINALNDKTPKLTQTVCNLLYRAYRLTNTLLLPVNKWMYFEDNQSGNPMIEDEEDMGMDMDE